MDFATTCINVAGGVGLTVSQVLVTEYFILCPLKYMYLVFKKITGKKKYCTLYFTFLFLSEIKLPSLAL